VRVVWDRHSRPRCRFSIDDNSFFLRDIAQQKYASLFDCFYLDLLRSLHKKYGVRFVLNIYYTTGDDFELPQFSARYKGEWEENSDWLKLAFHAHANEPARPYQYAPAEIMDGHPLGDRARLRTGLLPRRLSWRLGKLSKRSVTGRLAAEGGQRDASSGGDLFLGQFRRYR